MRVTTNPLLDLTIKIDAANAGMLLSVLKEARTGGDYAGTTEGRMLDRLVPLIEGALDVETN